MGGLIPAMWRHFRKRGVKDMLNEEKLEAYVEHIEIETDGLRIPADELVSYAEQLVWRMKVCAPCVKKGHCDGCGCDMPSGMTTPSFECHHEHFKEMLSPKEWEQFKIDYKIII